VTVDDGRDQVWAIFEEDHEQLVEPEDVAERLGIWGLTWLIQATLDAHYPSDVFGDENDVSPIWLRGDGGQGLDKGVKWAVLLRRAIAEVSE
jgi:hypothetical protein